MKLINFLKRINGIKIDMRNEKGQKEICSAKGDVKNQFAQEKKKENDQQKYFLWNNIRQKQLFAKKHNEESGERQFSTKFRLFLLKRKANRILEP